MTTSDRKRLSVAFVGHQGCGKSTILGHILLLLGHVDAVRAKKIDAAAIKKNARAARFAMVLFSQPFLTSATHGASGIGARTRAHLAAEN